MSSIFSKIINGDIPCYKIAENENCFAFLDISPVQKGHVLVVPKIETDKFFDQSIESLQELIVFAKFIASAIEKSFDCNRVGMTVIGLEVPHAHIHLIPINALRDMDFTKAKMSLDSSEMQSISESIKENLS